MPEKKFTRPKKKKHIAEALFSENDNSESTPEVSKSALKRQMTHLQKLGETLLKEKNATLEMLPISPTLLEAIQTAIRIKHREGKRRQMQFIGKLMRQEPADAIIAIEQLLERKHQRKQKKTEQHHLIEQWRDRLISEDTSATEAFLDSFPSADRQWLRQMIRQHRQENSRNKPPAAARKIFTYVQEIVETSTR